MTKLADAEYTLTQVAEGVEKYYLGIGEAPGVWTGRGEPPASGRKRHRSLRA